MSENIQPFPFFLLFFFVFSPNRYSSISFIITAATASNLPPLQPPPPEKEVILDLKNFLLVNNRINPGQYAGWNESDPSPCRWFGISCNSNGRITGINLNNSNINGSIFPHFYLLPELTHLDLSSNSYFGQIPTELTQCRGLRYLNLSHNFIDGELILSGFPLLNTLDASFNRLKGRFLATFPEKCGNLVFIDVSSNNFTGEIGDYFDGCRAGLRYLDLSLNAFTGELWRGFWFLREFSASDNDFRGVISPETFPARCNLEALDLSGNALSGNFPDSIANCSNLTSLNIWGNFFTGKIPSGVGLLTELESLFLGNNSFERDLPVNLLNCKKLKFLDLSRNQFGGEIQEIFGELTSLKFLILHSNSYTAGIEESGVLNLQNLLRLDLSFNNFSRKLPAAAADMPVIMLLILSHNDFYGGIPPEYGRISTLQVLDLSFNRLSGEIPPQVGNLTSLLWLMLANNEITGEIPMEIGQCSSLIWLNLANNSLSGRIPPEISTTGRSPLPTFAKNKRFGDLAAGSSECLTLKRWFPASFQSFSFIYNGMTRKRCSKTWDQLLKGIGLFPVCLNSSKPFQTLDSSGYLRLSSNLLYGELPSEIGSMKRLSLLEIEGNDFSGLLPSKIGSLPLIELDVSNNQFSGQIPPALGQIQCLQSLDLSQNNFSGVFPYSLNDLSFLNKFNVSFNPLLYGVIPMSSHITTFGNSSFLGDPLISFSPQNAMPPPSTTVFRRQSSGNMISLWVFVALTLFCLLFGIAFLFLCLTSRSRSTIDPLLYSNQDPTFSQSENLILDQNSIFPSPSGSSSSQPSSFPVVSVRVYGMNKTAFTYPDIVAATQNFSSDKLIGRGGCGEVYSGDLPDGRRVAIKKLQRGGYEGERQFRAEMETLAGGHPNLVALHGWCLAGFKKLLIYEYMEGGSLEDVIKDQHGFQWEQRMAAALAVAQALVYLHHDCSPAVLHRDVKASNVLMDGKGGVKLTDFGLARVVVDGTSHVSTVVAGTVGYVAPEYGQTWKATTKGDVYSFGVLLMELGTARRAVEEGEEEGLVEWWRRVGVEGVMAGMEGWGEEGGEVMRALVRVGMSCAVEAPLRRPEMREVLTLLLSVASREEKCGSLQLTG
ncbi:hypothetical protein KFK09_005892 [Dendrobium nobile]|uniref:non-specific serine/threonine protein kinase n=1 Tax=Dendrobium nobile TaxID=94219 RepID=A0A8T3BX25_DENNO|nr:hypothetical protein KFK09_005892 [Dendrobium nobile]